MTTSKLLLLITIAIEFCLASKVWQHDLNFDNPLNWANQNPPKPGQPLQFPTRLNAIVQFPSSVSSESITLPRDGVLMFPNGEASLAFGNGRKRQEPAIFQTPVRKPYYAIENWKTVDDNTNRLIEMNQAVPHLERIPCQYETAVFSETPSPVDFQYHEAIEVKDISYGGQRGLEEFRRFLVTDIGGFVFYNAEEILIREGKCKSPEKCSCQPEWVKGAVCPNEVCKIPYCTNPIVPFGHCCAICGSVLRMDLLNFGESFDLSGFTRKLERKIAASDVDKSLVDYHISVQNDALQLVIVDKKDYDEISVKLMNSLEPFFSKQFLNGHNILHAGHPYMPYESSQVFLLVFVSLLAVSMFFTIIYVYYYDDKMVPQITAQIRNGNFFRSPFVFARFYPNNDNEESTVDIDFNQSGVENLNSSFNNPMFEGNASGTSAPNDVGERAEEKLFVDVELTNQKPQ
ncbi:protein amnionless [Toxorhynchites rutilus septentrionalis]|uniref:protein amnionless n=1 Tax=Toxorhynchites rutilus septentrionalis TaxID=329112 RepID=UPI002479416A|nr:protein amnionless [Toxorhynchites rutilus septentrionalis]